MRVGLDGKRGVWEDTAKSGGMDMKEVSDIQAGKSLAAILEEVEADENFVVLRNGKRVAEIRPLPNLP